MPTKSYENDIERAKNRLKESEDILEAHRGTILDFDRHLELNDYSNARRYKYLVRLPKIAKELDVSFEEAERKDIEEVILWIKRKDDISDRTKNDYKILLKRFYKWIGEGEYPDCVDWLEINHSKSNDKLPEEMLVEEEVKKLIENAKNPRDKAIIILLWETGARIGELIDLTIGSIEDHKHGYKLVVDGKTGSRRLPLIESVPYLNKWLEEHPDRENKESPLWVNIGEVNEGKKMTYHAIGKMLNDVSNRANIDKPVNPHHFRHSRATYMATRFTEAQMCEWFGWVQSSDIPSKYTHLSGRDIDSDYASLHGVEEDEDRKESKLIPDECPRCGEEVSREASFCHRCGQALSVEATQKVENRVESILKKTQEIEEKISEKFLEYISENENVVEDFKKSLKNDGLTSDSKD